MLQPSPVLAQRHHLWRLMLADCCDWGPEVTCSHFTHQPLLYLQTQTLPKPALQCTEPQCEQANWVKGDQDARGPRRLPGGRVVHMCNQSRFRLVLPAQGHRPRMPCISVLQAPTYLVFSRIHLQTFPSSPRGCLQGSLPITPPTWVGWDHISTWPDSSTRMPSKTNAAT